MSGATRERNELMSELDEGAYAPKPAKRTKAFARSMRKDATDAEYLLWFELRNRTLNGYRFSRQVRIGVFIVDFCCREHRLVVELDGSQHSESAADIDRTQWLTGQGYRVLRFWNDEVVFERGAVLETILAALDGRLRPPHPTAAAAQLRFAVPSYPSPRRGEGSTHRQGETP